MISTGPGEPGYMVPRAKELLEEADTVVGYETYLDLLGPLIQGKETISTGMKQEVKRCEAALKRAVSGEKVAVVSSGDAGIYGMAGLILEICAARHISVCPRDGTERGSGEGPPDLFLEIVPGVPALCAGSALLGAAIAHDFCAISLSDLLTPWQAIEKRLDLAGRGDFVIALYNPRSKRRTWQLERAIGIIRLHRSPGTPVGIVRKAMRSGQEVTVTTLDEVLDHAADMQTVILVGNSRTYSYQGWMITPRGYDEKYSL